MEAPVFPGPPFSCQHLLCIEKEGPEGTLSNKLWALPYSAVEQGPAALISGAMSGYFLAQFSSNMEASFLAAAS